MMLKRLSDYIDKQQLFNKNQRILLAVSGGIDSMVMVSLFSKAKFNFAIAHCNFKLRGDESDADAEFVKKAAHELGVVYFEKFFNTRQLADQKKQSIQVAARELRYEWFNQLVAENNFDYFATAHQFDDQIETFFINLFRGTGVSGLRGILPKNGKCIRPMLFASRDEIFKYAVQNNILYREDSSNKSDKYLRNKIRKYVIPALQLANPDFRKGFLTTFNNLSATEKVLSNDIAKQMSHIAYRENDRLKLSLKELKHLHPLSFYLFEILKTYKFNFSTVEDICDTLDEISGKRFFSPTHYLWGSGDYLTIEPLNLIDYKDDKEYSIDSHQTSITDPVSLTCEKVNIDDKFTLNKDVSFAQLDFDKLQFPLKLRKWKPGDTFVPIGMKGKKMLSDFFIDKKIPFEERQKTWVLVSDNEIVWLIGHRISDKFKITAETTEALIIRINILNV